jgi:hypothetical protein
MMKASRISNEWLMGATAGAYLIVSFVLSFWGSAFLHYYCAVDVYYGPKATSGVLLSYMVMLIPGAVVGILDFMQLQLLQAGEKSVSQKAVRTALWMNFLGVVGLLFALSDKFGPDRNTSFLGAPGIAGIVLWPMGILLSIGNVATGYVKKLRASQS